MFGFGSDKEDRLKENMNEIKQMINEDDYGQKKAQEEASEDKGFDRSPDDGFESIDSEEGFEGEGLETESFGDGTQQQGSTTESFENDTEQQNPAAETFEGEGKQNASFEEGPAGDDVKQVSEFGDQGGSQGEVDRQQNQSFDEEFEPSERSRAQNRQVKDRNQQNTNQRKDEVEQESSAGQAERSADEEVEDSGSDLAESIPDAPETKEIDVPEIDKGPLFIRQKKFEAARNMIKEMHYLSREIEEVVGHLEEGIKQDRKTESDAKELLHKLDEDREGVKDIISPKKE